MTNAFYNDNDPNAVAWLLELITRGLIAPGCVSSRSITDLSAQDLAGYRRVHLFAGIAGWDLALRLAGWPDDREVWTASCPCQPFSDAGARRGVRDERNLWPAVLSLVAERRPATVFGEQVASRAGREWLARVRADMEGIGYAFGAADLCAASVGAPHIRQRLYWVADSTESRSKRLRSETGQEGRPATSRDCEALRLGNANPSGSQGLDRPNQSRDQGLSVAPSSWRDYDVLGCRDGKFRRVEPGTFPLANGVPARVGRLCGYGNAIVPQVAATFVRCFDDVMFARKEA